MDYPKELSNQAQARIEGEKIRAEQEFDAAKNKIPPDYQHGDGNKIRPLLTHYILRVFSVFGHEAWDVGRSGIWTAAKVDSEAGKFLEVLTRLVVQPTVS